MRGKRPEARGKDAARSLLESQGVSAEVLSRFDSLLDLYADRVEAERRPSPSAQRSSARSGAARIWRTVELLERDDIGEAILTAAALSTRHPDTVARNIGPRIDSAVATLRAAAALLELAAASAARAPRGEREKFAIKWLEAEATRALREAGIRRCRLLARDWIALVREAQAAREADERRRMRAEKRPRR